MDNKFSYVMKALLASVGRKRNPDPHVWIFSSKDNEQFNYNSKYLFEYVKEHVEGVIPRYVINDTEKRKQYQREYGVEYFVETKTIHGIRQVLDSGVWFTSAGLPVYRLGLRRKNYIVNLWHGVPLKKIALLDCNLRGIARAYFRAVFSHNYRYVVTTSSSLVPVMQESFDVKTEQVKVWGQPRNDKIFQKKSREAILQNLYGELPEYEKVILYAPTFRDVGETKLFPFADMDWEVLTDFLQEHKILIFIRSHLEDEAAMKQNRQSRIFFMNSDVVDDVTGILDIFDMLITDYSSIYIDYLLTEKPMVFLPYDKEAYLAGRGMNFSYDDVTPGPKPVTMQKFLNEMEHMLSGIDEYQERRKECNTFFNEIKEPCSRKICEAIIREVGIDARIKAER